MTTQEHIDGMILTDEKKIITASIKFATEDLLNEGFDHDEIKTYLTSLICKTVDGVV